MADVLLATCTALPTGDPDDGELIEALARHGVSARWVAWTDPQVDWAAAPVVLRSTWDYAPRRGDYLAWARGLPRVLNPAPVVEWNTDKIYLRELADAGVPVVPTSVVAEGDPLVLPPAVEVVVKPSVGAGSVGAGRFHVAQSDDIAAQVAVLHRAGRTALVQPYLDEVDVTGEAALIYLDGRFSHAITKGAMLSPGTAHTLERADLFVDERIEARTASAAERAVGDAALAFVRGRFGADPLYARVDLLPAAAGPVVVELELTEPSLFFGFAAGAVDAFAEAIAGRLSS